MKIIKVICAALLMAAIMQAQAQDKFEKVKSVKNIKATVKLLGGSMTVIIPDREPNQRYSAIDLPEELKKDGLRISINGDIGAIPPNVRMIGTPFRITCIKVTAAGQKKYKLSKRSYCLIKK